MPVRPPLITLLTDFGLDDTYVGQMRGVIAGICPQATVVDLTHAVRPQQVEQGAFLLETSLAAFPEGTIHLAVVDPGVGTDRAALLIEAGGRTFIGPDNGLLSCAVPDEHRPAIMGRISLPSGIRATILTAESGRSVAPTFHGRDLFAVAAARFADYRDAAPLGTPADAMLLLPPFRAEVGSGTALEARVVHIDRFGNVITTVRASQLTGSALGGRRLVVTIGTQRIGRFVRTYGAGDGLVALIGSSGYLEVAEVNGNAAARTGASIGQRVVVEAEV